jgi:hypothetical protein
VNSVDCNCGEKVLVRERGSYTLTAGFARVWRSTRSVGEKGCLVTEPKGSILLVYFVADESGSMGRNIDELNAGLSSLHDALQRESFAAAKVRLSVIGFSDTAFTYLEPADMRVLQGMPVLTAQSLTSYAAAFDQLTYRIRVDVPSLKAQGYTVHRPAAFFLTDGLPTGICWPSPRRPTFWLSASERPTRPPSARLQPSPTSLLSPHAGWTPVLRSQSSSPP